MFSCTVMSMKEIHLRLVKEEQILSGEEDTPRSCSEYSVVRPD